MGALAWVSAHGEDSTNATTAGGNATVSAAAGLSATVGNTTAASVGAASGNGTDSGTGASVRGLPMPGMDMASMGGAGSAAPEVIAEPAPMPADSPERHAQDTLRAYLAEAEPKRLDALNTLKFDRTQITERMDILAKTGAADELMDAYLYYLTAYPPDPKKFLEVMTRLAVLLNERGSDAGLLTLLFQEGEQFPANRELAVHLQLTEAEYLLKVGLPQAALVRLHQLSAEPGIDPSLRVLAIGRAGFLHERLGQPDEALAAYLQTEQDLTTVPQANEAILRAGLLLLEQGKPDKASEVLQKLQTVPEDVLAKSPAAPAVTEMRDLAKDPAAAKAYWSHADAWFPLWLKLAPSLGVDLEQPAQVVGPSAQDYQRLALEANQALNSKDKAHYFAVVNMLMRSARWRPSDMADAVNLLYQGLRLAPDRTDDLLALGAAMDTGLPAQQATLEKQMVQLRVGTLVDMGHPELGRDLAAAALAKYGADGTQGQALVRLYGFAVARSNAVDKPAGAEAIRYLSDSLKDPDAHGQQRALAVAVLCDLYLAAGQEDTARAVLEKELAAPERTSTGGAQYEAALRDSLDRLQQRQTQTAGMDTGLNAWVSAHALPWQAYATQSKEAGYLSTVDDAAVQVARSFARALDPAAQMPARASAMMDAWNSYPALPLTGTAMVGATVDFMGRTDLPESLRYMAWVKAMWHLLWTGQRAAAEKLLAGAPTNPLVAEDRVSQDLWLDYLGQAPEIGAQQAFADKLLAHPKLNRFDLVLAVRVIETLARQGSPDAAQAVFTKLQAAAMDDSATEQFRGLRDNIGPLIEQYRNVQPAYEALRAVVLKERATDAAAAQLPDAWKDLNDPEIPDLDLLTPAAARTGLLAVIRDRLPYGRHPLQVFLDYGEALPVDAADNALRFKLFQTAQAQVTRDEDRFYAAMFTELVDFDDPDLARQGWAALSGGNVAAQYPKTADFLQYYKTLMDWRAGETTDVAAAFGPLDAPGLDAYKLRLVLDNMLQRADAAGLQKLLAERPETDFLQPTVLGGYLKALRLLGQQDKLAKASDVARAELAKVVVQSWARPERETADPAFDLAEGLQDPAAYPRAWVEYLEQQMQNDNARDLVRMEDARLQQDWAGLLAAAESYLGRNPTQYDYYWAKAQALIELGRTQEALEPLRVYLKYSHNDEDYPAAAEWRKKIEGEPAAPTRNGK